MPADFKAISRDTPSAASPRASAAPAATLAASRQSQFINYGTINFTLHNTTENAEFVLVEQDTRLHDVASHMIEEWGLEKPGIILRVTGTLDAREAEDMEDVLEGVVHSASEANGFIFSAGLDFGISSLIGNIIAAERHRCQAPLIGVSSWVSVQGRDQLHNSKAAPAKGGKRKYEDGKPDADMSTISLQPVHTHFVLVDFGEAAQKDASLSTEAKLLNANTRAFNYAHDLEEAIATLSSGGHTPRVLVVLNGDATTLNEVVEYSREGNGIVLIAALTGGLAEALASFVRTGKIAESWKHHTREFEEIRTLNAKARERSATAGSAPREGDVAWPLLELSDGLTKASILDSVLAAAMRQAGDAATKVQYAVEWHDAERLKSQISLIPAWDPSRVEILRDALQLSLELQHERCVAACIGFAAPVKQVDLLAIYDELYDEKAPPLIYLFKGEPMPTERLARHKEGKVEKGLSVNLDDPVYRFYPVEVWALIKQQVPDLCSYWRKKVSHLGNVDAGGNFVSGYVKLEEESTSGNGSAAAAAAAAASKEVGPKWLDIYVWAVLLGKTELALTILPACREPMRAAVIGARLCSVMAIMQPLHFVALERYSDIHENWAIGLLDLCETFEEARRMLVTTSPVWRQPLLHMAVASDLRPLCCHVHCQTLGDEWMSGNDDFDKPSVVINGQDVSMTRMFIFMLLPLDTPWLICGYDSILTWKVPLSMHPKEVEKMGPPSTWAFYTIPRVKYIVRVTTHIAFTILLSYVALETPMTWFEELEEGLTLHDGAQFTNGKSEFGHEGGGIESYRTDAIVWLWTISLMLDEFYKFAVSMSNYEADFWNTYDAMTFGLVQFALILRFQSIQGAVEILCFAVVAVWGRMFKYLQLDYNLGVLVIILMRMTKDIAMWITMSSIVLLAFTVSFTAIANPYVVEASGNHPYSAPIWAMLGSYDLVEVHEWNPSVGKTMMWIYLLIAQVILVNLLIAMMGNTFSEVKEHADREWKYGRLKSVIEVTERFSALPPPLNIGLTLWTLVEVVHRKLTTGFMEIPMEHQAELGEAELAQLAEAKRAKARVARKLLFALRCKEEDEADKQKEMLAQQGDQLTSVQKDIKDLAWKLDELTRVVTASATQSFL
jgi:hypothetical protein